MNDSTPIPSRRAGMEKLDRWIGAIGVLDAQAMEAARRRQEQLTKPRGALGRLEALSIHLAGITGQARPSVAAKEVLVMAADHGVAAEGVSAYPQSVTAQMVHNFLAGGAAINVLARQARARVVVIDMGVATPMPDWPGLIRAAVAPGTANFAHGPAMTREQALQALLNGAELAAAEIDRGVEILGTGEMGIGNTTAAAAIAAALTGRDPGELVGPGTGLDAAGVARKADVVRGALALNRPDAGDAVDVLAKVGGFEIGGLAGAILAAAARRCPVMLDGYIATAAAMLAVRLAPAVRDYVIAAHCSAEPGHAAMLAWLGLEPLLALEMRLGEGTGAVLGMILAEAACRTLDEMATFDEAGVDDRPATH